MKKIFSIIVVTFILSVLFAVSAFASTATMYNKDGNLCNLWGSRVYSAGEATINGTIYENNGRKFFHNNNGTDPTDLWIDIDGKGDWHYAGSDCYFVKDTWVKFGSKSYYLDGNGNWTNTAPAGPNGPGNTSPTVTTGWRKMNGKWRYYTNNSTYLTGWQWLPWSKGTSWFYFGSDGYMYSNTCTPDGYWVDSNGVWNGDSCCNDNHSTSSQQYCTHCGRAWKSSSGHYCSKCGGDNREAGIYCKHCGNTSERTYCYLCGKKTADKNAKFCSRCGENLSQLAIEDRVYCGKCGKKLPH